MLCANAPRPWEQPVLPDGSFAVLSRFAGPTCTGNAVSVTGYRVETCMPVNGTYVLATCGGGPVITFRTCSDAACSVDCQQTVYSPPEGYNPCVSMADGTAVAPYCNTQPPSEASRIGGSVVSLFLVLVVTLWIVSLAY